ncbi:hypothetical protein R3P38DRAFT_2771900 [Favolaschia claudopus]|uniref:Uncharacterized protein n=1 Tax=Favolaschia claudopus TaxID=2862362 RepID=A0AAW0C923_9AGAR
MSIVLRVSAIETACLPHSSTDRGLSMKVATVGGENPTSLGVNWHPAAEFADSSENRFHTICSRQNRWVFFGRPGGGRTQYFILGQSTGHPGLGIFGFFPWY